jgi:hypothetical protein
MDLLIDGIKRFKEEAQHISEEFPFLNLVYVDNLPCLKGIITLFDEKGEVVDEYEILIKAIAEYPNKFPKIFELGGKIPHNIDWHIYSDGSCCIASPPEERLACVEKYTLVEFIKKHVLPYFFNQTFRRENGYFLKERSHGDKGWVEFFFETLKTNNIKNVITALEFILSKKNIDRTALCFCGSGEKFRKCHRESFKVLKKLPDEDLIYYINKLKF